MARVVLKKIGDVTQNGYGIVKTAEVIWEGHGVGEDVANGMMRPLAGGDIFQGHSAATSATGDSATVGVPLYGPEPYILEVAIAGAAITDLDALVYMSDSTNYTLTAFGNSLCGRVVRFISTGIVWVQMEPHKS